MADAFYVPSGDGFSSTDSTAGPWAPDAQHFGPPAALLTRELEGCGDDGGALARITVEILGPVPIAELRTGAQVDRPGKSVQLLSAELRTADRAVARASAWRLASTDTSAQASGAAPALAPPQDGVPFGRPEGWSPGYIDAVEWCALSGSFQEPGPATVWARQRIPLVSGEEPTPLQRLMTIADSASGVSTWLDPTRFLFINTELTVHVQREPVGEWIGLDARTVLGPNGTGTAVSVIHDEQGQVANSSQTLLVRPR
ncbi:MULTISPECIES: thioesterase family protein [unclassified Saccharopolyspora]|uniref:thioesterase family protein n=1 Tax=Saccharopolyspora TaxID=1835 RepID=UPI00190BEF8E|nr:thioesterase family protein [Saccharopolyspora sp. HNM0986]MBK0870631.1 thioesterase family protein [Saccharopolyspora sp. HNM0986]